MSLQEIKMPTLTFKNTTSTALEKKKKKTWKVFDTQKIKMVSEAK